MEAEPGLVEAPFVSLVSVEGVLVTRAKAGPVVVAVEEDKTIFADTLVWTLAAGGLVDSLECWHTLQDHK